MYDDVNFKEQKISKRRKKLEYQLPDRSSRKTEETTPDTITNQIETTTSNAKENSVVGDDDEVDDGLIYIQYQEANHER